MARVPRQTAPDGSSSAAYGDWSPTAGAVGHSAALGEPAGDLLVRPAPTTTVIPERTVTGRRGRAAGTLDEESPEVVRDPGTGSAAGGRAAGRAERQAADMARRKAVARRNGGSTSALPPEPEEGEPRKPRRVLTGLVAMAVVGLGVLGVYTAVAPAPQDASAQTPAITTAPTSAPTNELPPLPTEPAPIEPVATAPIRVPVTVLNATDVTGLAGKISTAIVGAGWESPGVGAYKNDDVPVSTVFFTEGDENQRQAALQLIEQFPQLSGPAPRFFELPADAAPGLVVVAAGEWQP